jgi:ABC-2 type transport system ATP-binding protein
VTKVWLATLAGALAFLGGGVASGSTAAKQDVSIPMDDGVSIAATLYLPEGTPPPGGWPAIVLLHGLGGNRQQINALIEAYAPFTSSYAILTFDARGYGDSGGLVSVDGPREVADTRAVRDWLAARPDVSDTRVGAWGISYGGGAVLNSLVAGVPWAAVAVVETWVDLGAALFPQGLLKSGVVAGLADGIPETRRDMSLAPLALAALSGSVSAARPWAAARSSLAKLGSVTTPVFMAQGRRDFLFSLDQGTRAFTKLAGPKELYVGLHGHAPSSFPAVDTPLLLSRTALWFDCYLRDACPTPALPKQRVEIVPENYSGNGDAGVAKRGTLPPVAPSFVSFPGVSTFAQTGKATRTSRPLRAPIEIFGAPTVQASLAASGGWSRLVAVLTAKTRAGKEIVVSEGGVPTRPGAQKVTIHLMSQATYVPKGARLTLTLGSSSTKQSPSNLVYLDLPMPSSARARVGTATLKLPGLRTPVTK